MAPIFLRIRLTSKLCHSFLTVQRSRFCGNHEPGWCQAQLIRAQTLWLSPPIENFAKRANGKGMDEKSVGLAGLGSLGREIVCGLQAGIPGLNLTAVGNFSPI